MHAHFRRLSFTDMQIGPAVFDDYAEELIQVRHFQNRGLRG